MQTDTRAEAAPTDRDVFVYRPALDGIRALAVVAVLVCHSPIPHGEGGALGVDVFFVLSGYLITSLLAAELDRRDGISFGRFYARRAWRLWPPLLATIVLATALPPFPAISPAPRWKSDLIAATYLSNWWPHIDSHHTLGYLSHTWSLAVEEQFYLVWPVLLVVFLRLRLSAWWLFAPVTALVALRVETSVLPGRFDGLIIGALIALLARDAKLPPWIAARTTAWVGIGIAFASALVGSAAHGGGDRFQLAITTVAIGTALVIANLAARPNTLADRLLSNRWLVEIGKLSYTIYLVHYPIFLWVDSRHLGRAETFGLELLLTAPAVVACWLLVEKPARRMKARWSTVGATDAVAAERGLVGLPDAAGHLQEQSG